MSDMFVQDNQYKWNCYCSDIDFTSFEYFLLKMLNVGLKENLKQGAKDALS